MKPGAIACALLPTGDLHAREATNPAPAIAPEAVPLDWSFAVSVLERNSKL
jgi:hypothetical protein